MDPAPDPVCSEWLDPDPDLVCPERLDPDPDLVNIRPDPKPWLQIFTFWTFVEREERFGE